MGLQTWQIGEVTITKVTEMEQRWPGFAVIPQATPAAMKEHDWVLGPFADPETGRIRLSFHAFCIEAGDRKIVVDTCAGNNKVRPNFEALGGLHTDFLERMTEAGFGPDDVTDVVCTHLHVDHVGWNTSLVNGVWTPTFPKARYLFGATEWNHWKDEPQVYGDVVGDSIRPCIDAGLADLVGVDHRISDNVWFESTPGHTPGHISLIIESAGQRAVITGDMVHSPLQIDDPELAAVVDSDQVQSRVSRREAFARWAQSGALVIGTHFADPSAGRMVNLGGGKFRLDV